MPGLMKALIRRKDERHASTGDYPAGLIHRSDKGVQNLAVRHTQRLSDAGAVAKVRSRGDSYGNVLAEAINSSSRLS